MAEVAKPRCRPSSGTKPRHPAIEICSSANLSELFVTTARLATSQALISRKAEAMTPRDRDLAQQIIDEEVPLHPGLTDDERFRNEDQRKAVFQLTTRRGGVQVLEGMAGTGKTYTLNVCKKIWERAGFRVTAMVSGVLPEELQDNTGNRECDDAPRDGSSRSPS